MAGLRGGEPLRRRAPGSEAPLCPSGLAGLRAPCLTQGFSSGGEVSSGWAFVTVCRHAWLSQLGRGRRWQPARRGQDAAGPLRRAVSPGVPRARLDGASPSASRVALSGVATRLPQQSSSAGTSVTVPLVPAPCTHPSTDSARRHACEPCAQACSQYGPRMPGPGFGLPHRVVGSRP